MRFHDCWEGKGRTLHGWCHLLVDKAEALLVGTLLLRAARRGMCKTQTPNDQPTVTVGLTPSARVSATPAGGDLTVPLSPGRRQGPSLPQAPVVPRQETKRELSPEDPVGAEVKPVTPA